MTTPLCYPLGTSKRNPGVKVCAIVPDLPQYMYLGAERANVLRKAMRKLHQKIAYSNTKYIDKFVLLTEHMAEILKCNSYTVMEGIAPKHPACPPDAAHRNGTKHLMYMGTIRLKYGLDVLCKAMDYINADECILHVYGDGEDTLLF